MTRTRDCRFRGAFDITLAYDANGNTTTKTDSTGTTNCKASERNGVTSKFQLSPWSVFLQDEFRRPLVIRLCQANGQSPEMQLRELREYCERRGWQIAGEYIDVGISGAKDRRPGLDRMMADAHKRRFDVVAVWKFDRFARSVSHLLRALDTFRVLGIEFVSLSESLDTATPAGRMVFTVLGAVAELERSLIAERVRAGLRNAKAKGRKLGRPRIVMDASQIARLRSQGASWRDISKQLGVSIGTAHAAMR